MFNPHLFQVFLRPSFGAYAPPSPNLTFYAYALLRRVGRLSSIVFPSGNLSRRCAPLSPKGKAFYPGICAPLSPKGKAFLYIMLIHILFCSAMPAKNNTNLGLAACFQANTLFRNRHIRVYYAVCAPRLSLKTRRNTCRQPKRRYFR